MRYYVRFLQIWSHLFFLKKMTVQLESTFACMFLLLKLNVLLNIDCVFNLCNYHFCSGGMVMVFAYQKTWLVFCILYSVLELFALLEEMHSTTWIIIECTAKWYAYCVYHCTGLTSLFHHIACVTTSDK